MCYTTRMLAAGVVLRVQQSCNRNPVDTDRASVFGRVRGARDAACSASATAAVSWHPGLRVLALVPVLLATPILSSTAQTIRGHITEGKSGRPLEAVAVDLLNPQDTVVAHTETMADGRYQLRIIRPGRYRARFLLPGFQPWLTEPFDLTERQTLDISPQLIALAPFNLDSIVVYGESVPRYLEDFYRRSRQGFGYFLTRADIDRHSPVVMSDVLRGLAGVQVVCGRRSCDVLTRAARTMFFRGVCRPSVILDGAVIRVGGVAKSGDLALDDILNPFNIEAVEVYPSPAGVPVQYQGYVSPCGAIIAWSRR